MGFLSDAKKKERNFGSLLGEKFVFASKEQDIFEHWDIEFEGKKYDVKGVKKVTRDDVYPNEFYHYIEIKNVNGRLGWLYGGADFFAFETNRFWIVVEKLELQNFVKENIKKIKVTSADESLYCLYTRAAQDDVITMVKTIDLMVIADRIIHKKIDIIEDEIGESVYVEKRIKKKISNLKLKE